jgi:Skp family chaperone for outer membrane proteins
MDDPPKKARSAHVKFSSLATLVASLFVFSLNHAPAQENAAAAPAAARARPTVDHGVRVIDVKRVFDEYYYFKEKIEELRVLVKGFEEQQREEQKKILDEEKKIPELKPGSPERKELEKKIFQMKTDLAAGAKIKQAEFMEREAKVYFHTYTAIQDEVAYYCQVKGVAVVISYNSEKADQNSRQSIMRAMTNTVVACDPSVDITNTILRVLNRNAPAKTSNQGGPKIQR